MAASAERHLETMDQGRSFHIAMRPWMNGFADADLAHALSGCGRGGRRCPAHRPGSGVRRLSSRLRSQSRLRRHQAHSARPVGRDRSHGGAGGSDHRPTPARRRGRRSPIWAVPLSQPTWPPCGTKTWRQAVPVMSRSHGPLRVGIGGPVGSGKTTLTEKLCKAMRERWSIAVVTNDIYTKEDALILNRLQALAGRSHYRGGDGRLPAYGDPRGRFDQSRRDCRAQPAPSRSRRGLHRIRRRQSGGDFLPRARRSDSLCDQRLPGRKNSRARAARP